MTIATQTTDSKPEAVATPTAKIAVLVDDDANILFVSRLCLERLGYEVISFSDGVPALKYFTDGGRADLLLTDNDMPVMKGLELLRELKAQSLMPENTILNSGGASASLAAEVEGLGAKFLKKPFEMSQLKSAIEAQPHRR